MDIVTILFIAWLITKAVTSDAPYAFRGKMPPQHLERMERLRRGEAVPLRYGFGDYLKDLFDFALRADIERRKRKAARKQQVAEEQSSPPQPAPDRAAEQPEATEVPDPSAGPAPPKPTPAEADGGKAASATSPGRTEGDRARRDAGPTPAGAASKPATPPQTTQPTSQPAARVIQFPVPPTPFAKPNQQGEAMGATTDTNPSGVTEVTGLASAIEYAKGVSAAHEQHGGSEAFASSLAGFDVGPETIGKVMAAREASTNAAAKWAEAAAAIEDNNAAVREAYASSAGEAGDKRFATSE